MVGLKQQGAWTNWNSTMQRKIKWWEIWNDYANVMFLIRFIYDILPTKQTFAYGLKQLVGWVLWYINLCRLFNAESIFMQKSVLFQTIQFSLSTRFNFQKTFLFQAIQFIQTVLIQTIQLSISTDFVYTVKCQNNSLLNNSV